MNPYLHRAFVLGMAALAPLGARAALIDRSEVTLTAFANHTSSAPPRNDAGLATAPHRGPQVVEARALVNAGDRTVPFPNLPTHQTQAFASAAGDNFGAFGVGVSGFFFVGSLPPHALAAGGSFAQTLTNNSSETVAMFTEFFIPEPTTRFFGIGDFFPAGRDPALDAFAQVEVRMFTHVTHPDGTVTDATAFDYGMEVARDAGTGTIVATALNDALPERPTEFDASDGSFGFRMPALRLTHFLLANLAPGDVLEFRYDYLARARTGFGETGVFAASGDPFDLSANAGAFDFSFESGTTSVAEPASAMLVGVAALALWPFTGRRRRIFRPRKRGCWSYTRRSGQC
jgi:hypothetical protein